MKLAEKVLNTLSLDEMANAIPKYTGINGALVYFSTAEESPNPQAHALGRVKLIKGNTELGTISIKKDKTGNYKVGGFDSGDGKKLFPLIKKFVGLNQEILWKYWNTPALKADSASTMQNFKKV